MWSNLCDPLAAVFRIDCRGARSGGNREAN